MTQSGSHESKAVLPGLIHQGRIVFGCGRLHHLHRPEPRQRLLRAALEVGITRFDVAPAYGNGLAERALGSVPRSLRRQVRVNTKVGIHVWVYPLLADRAFPLVRGLDMLAGSHRRAYGRRDFRTVELRESLERSLRRLAIDAVDTYFLHEPVEPFAEDQWNEISQTMGSLVTAGKARSWGIAGPSHRYGLDGLNTDSQVALQQPLAEISQPVPGFVNERLAYGTYAAYRQTRTGDSFETFLGQMARRYPEVTFLVSTCDEGRLRRWAAEGSS
jgi:aryl-alcohol dehydrogenase-like predicted oxidoreductase